MPNTHHRPLLDLQPTEIWKQFQLLCDTPRPSFHEQKIRQIILDWAQGIGLTCYIDTCGNLLIKKSASTGMEERKTVVLQGHLDIVAQKNEQTVHDFVNDPILTQINDGWVSAIGTTLGADNGIGVAAALAVLASDDIAHGPIEALFTIEEETSLRGATELECGILQGTILLNLDSEDRGEVYIGCAGGVDINGVKNYVTQATSADSSSYELKISGLRGGHSGLDIHKGVGSANIILARLLDQLNKQCDFSISSIEGGTLRNAIARDAVATLNFTASDFEQAQQIIEQQLAIFKAQLKGVDDYLEIALNLADKAQQQITPQDQAQIINLLYALPHGVESMSRELENVTHTSINLGVIRLTNGEFSVCLLARSLQDSQTDALAQKTAACFALAGINAEFDSEYPGWLPDPSTGLLKQFLDIHQQEMGFPAKVKVIHAGLECGIIGAKYPNMEMVSFGPNIRGAHSPQERLEISSVDDFWRLLVKLLASL
jgi:dipeptidase D